MFHTLITAFLLVAVHSQPPMMLLNPNGNIEMVYKDQKATYDSVNANTISIRKSFSLNMENVQAEDSDMLLKGTNNLLRFRDTDSESFVQIESVTDATNANTGALRIKGG